MHKWIDWAFTLAKHSVIGVPIYLAAPVMIVVGALDSSLLTLPEINDYLVIMRCAGDHKSVFYFPLFAAAGSVLGCIILYSIVRRGGQAVLRRRFRVEHIQKVERAYARFGFLALAAPALTPPPMPFKIFVATAGAMEYPRWRFILTIMIARSLRYYVEGALAVFYGKAVLDFLQTNALFIMSIVATAALLGLVVYALTLRLGSRRSANAAQPTTGPVVLKPEQSERIEDTP